MHSKNTTGASFLILKSVCPKMPVVTLPTPPPRGRGRWRPDWKGMVVWRICDSVSYLWLGEKVHGLEHMFWSRNTDLIPWTIQSPQQNQEWAHWAPPVMVPEPSQVCQPSTISYFCKVLQKVWPGQGHIYIAEQLMLTSVLGAPSPELCYKSLHTEWMISSLPSLCRAEIEFEFCPRRGEHRTQGRLRNPR